MVWDGFVDWKCLVESPDRQKPDQANDELLFLLRFPLRTRGRETPRKVVFGRMVVDEDVAEDQHENGVCRASLNSVHVARSK